jgi:hypothetical protein
VKSVKHFALSSPSAPTADFTLPNGVPAAEGLFVSMHQHNTIGKGSARRAVNGGRDEYFTRPAIANGCIWLTVPRYGRRPLYVEPSAGNGAFADILRQRRFKTAAYDLNPTRPDITRADWFSVTVPRDCVVIGNPPFGFAASLAVKFFNHAATGAKAIAFIVPRSFQKSSVQRRLDRRFWLVAEDEIADHAFLLDGQPYDVPCVFQIWERRNTERNVARPSLSNPFIVFTPPGQGEYAIRRVGGQAGQILRGTDHNPNTTIWFNSIGNPSRSGHAMAAIQPALRQIRDKTAGVRSVSKTEIASLLNAYAAGRTA